MEARRFVLGSAILGLFWSGLFKGALTNSMNRCDYPPCSCDSHGRLTCDCKEEGEVCSYVAVKLCVQSDSIDYYYYLARET